MIVVVAFSLFAVAVVAAEGQIAASADAFVLTSVSSSGQQITIMQIANQPEANNENNLKPEAPIYIL